MTASIFICVHTELQKQHLHTSVMILYCELHFVKLWMHNGNVYPGVAVAPFISLGTCTLLEVHLSLSLSTNIKAQHNTQPGTKCSTKTLTSEQVFLEVCLSIVGLAVQRAWRLWEFVKKGLNGVTVQYKRVQLSHCFTPIPSYTRRLKCHRTSVCNLVTFQAWQRDQTSNLDLHFLIIWAVSTRPQSCLDPDNRRNSTRVLCTVVPWP